MIQFLPRSSTEFFTELHGVFLSHCETQCLNSVLLCGNKIIPFQQESMLPFRANQNLLVANFGW